MKIEQFSLFKSTASPQKVLPPVLKKARPPFSITLAIGADKRVRMDEGILTLRLLGNRYIRNIVQQQIAKKLLLNLKQEIKIKKGIIPMPAAIQNALLISENLSSS